MIDPISIACFILAGVLGLCLGSFSTALIYRSPRGISWIVSEGKGSRSACPTCQAQLEARDLIPVLSWILSRAKCRHCGVKIPAFYPVTELVCLVIVLSLYGLWGPVPAIIPVLFLVPFLIAIVVIDWERMIIPDDLNLSVFVLGLLYVGLGWVYAPELWMGQLAASILLPSVFWLVSFILERWKGRQALGMGDIKFLAGAGFFIGIDAIPLYLFFSGVMGLLTALFSAFQGKKGAFPFGPALVFSLLLHLFLTGLGFDYTWLIY